jgi:hypothetical protein
MFWPKDKDYHKMIGKPNLGMTTNSGHSKLENFSALNFNVFSLFLSFQLSQHLWWNSKIEEILVQIK